MQRTGNIHRVGVGYSNLIGAGYSGYGEHRNNPESEKIEDLGPIPQGEWTMGTLRDNTTGSGAVLHSSIRLTPSAETDTFGRAGFLIHGDNSTGLASAGCIIAPLAIREQIGHSGDDTLRVVAEEDQIGHPAIPTFRTTGVDNHERSRPVSFQVHSIGAIPPQRPIGDETLLVVAEEDQIGHPRIPTIRTTGVDNHERSRPVSFQVHFIGAIPPQRPICTPENASTLEFVVRSADGGPEAQPMYTCVATPPAKGHLHLDGSSGLFEYRPDAADAFGFSVEFCAAIPGKADQKQTVEIQPWLEVAPDGALMQAGAGSGGELPDPADGEYQVWLEDSRPGGTFNTVAATSVRKIRISGMRLILESDSLAYPLHSALNGSKNIEELTLLADEVVIKSPLHLPQTKFTVYARILRFEDKDPAKPAKIDTTPVGWDLQAPSCDRDKGDGAKNGETGHPAGDISLFVGQLTGIDGPTVRFVARGAKAQDGGEGSEGKPGRILPEVKGVSYTGAGVIWLEYATRKSSNEPKEGAIYWGSGERTLNPTNGGDAFADGVSGVGGAGGRVSSAVWIPTAIVDTAGGPSGRKGQFRKGGARGLPDANAWQPGGAVRRKAVHNEYCKGSKEYYECYDYWTQENFEVLPVTREGKDEAATQPEKAQGADGTLDIRSSRSTEWLHPLLVAAVISYSRDLYQYGNMAEAGRVLSEYGQYLLSEVAAGSPANPEFSHQLLEIDTLLHRISTNRDYYGNPAGWVPVLSLAGTLRLFSQEVESAFEVLYLAMWTTSVAKEKEERRKAFQVARQQLRQEVQRSIAQLNQMQTDLPNLQLRCANLNDEVTKILSLLRKKEADLLERAKHDVEAAKRLPAWKDSLRVLSTICKVIPVYQPVLGAVGTGFDLVRNVDSQNPIESIQKGKALLDQFNDAKLKESQKSLDKFVSRVSGEGMDGPKYLEDMQKLTGDFRGALDQIRQATAAQQAPAGEVASALQRIKASDQEWIDLSNQTAKLNREKESLVSAIQRSIQRIATLTAELAGNLHSMDRLDKSVSTAALEYDHVCVSYIRTMEHRARERLAYYLYLLSRAYEYRMLRPFPVNPRIPSIVSRVASFLKKDTEAHLTKDSLGILKSIYVEAARSVIHGAIEEIQTKGMARSRSYSYELSDGELVELSGADRSVTMPLGIRLPAGAGEENRRIAGLRFTNVKVEAASQGVDSGPPWPVFFTATHSGRTVQRGDGKYFAFDHRLKDQNAGYSWKASVDNRRPPEQQVKNDTLADDGIGELCSFLNVPSDAQGQGLTGKEQVWLFAYPGAEGDLQISFDTPMAGYGYVVRSMTIELDIHYTQGDGNMVSLDIITAGGITPYIRIDTQDMSGRSLGRGTFRRVYWKSQTIVLSAQPSFGGRRFTRWVDNTGMNSTDIIQEVVLQTDRRIWAIYD